MFYCEYLLGQPGPRGTSIKIKNLYKIFDNLFKQI